MATDATLLTVGVEPVGIDDTTKQLSGLEQQAGKTEQATEKLAASVAKTAPSYDKAGSAAEDSRNKIIRWNAALQDYEIVDRAAAAHENLANGLKKVAASSEEGLRRLGNMSEAHSKLSESTKSSTKELALFGVAMGSAGEVVRRVIEAIASMVKAYMEWEEQQSKLNAMLKITGTTAEVTAQHVADLAIAYQESGQASEASIVRASNALLKFSGVQGPIFDKAIQASVDLAALMGGDVASAAEMVGRALENSYGTSMLRRMGLLTDAQVEYLKAIKDTLGESEYQARVLDIINDKTRDLAKNMGADGLSGAWKQLTEEIGHDVRVATEWVLKALDVENRLRELTDAIKELRKNPLSAIFAPEEIKLMQMADTVMRFINPQYRQMAESRDAAAAAAERSAKWSAYEAGENHRNAESARKVKEANDERAKATTDALKEAKGYVDQTERSAIANETLEQRLLRLATAYRDNADVQEYWEGVAKKAGTTVYDAMLKAAEGTIKHTTAHKASNSEAERGIALYERMVASLSEMTERDRAYAEIERQIDQIRKSGAGYTKQELDDLEAKKKAQYDLQVLQKLQAQADKDQEAFTNRQITQAENVIKSTEGQIDAMKRQIASLKGGKEAGQEYTTQMLERKLADEEWMLVWTEWTQGEDSPVVAELKKEIETTREAIKTSKELTEAQRNHDAQVAAQKQQKAIEDDWKKTAHTIDEALTDALMDGFEKGKSFAENFRNALVDMFKTLILRPIIQFIIDASGISGFLASFAGAFKFGGASGLSGAAGAAGGGGWSNYLSNPRGLGGTWNWVTGGGWGSPAAYAAAVPGLTTFAPGSQAAILASQTADFGFAGTQLTAAAGGATGLTAGLGAFAPMLPLLAVGLPLLAGLFDNEPSEVRGRFRIAPPGTTTGFEDNAYTSAGKYGNLGFSDADTMYFSGRGAQAFNAVVKNAIDAFDARFSKEQSDRFAETLKNMTFDAFEGTYTTEDFIKQYGGKVLKQVVSAAFDELDPAMAVIIRAFEGTTEEISTFTNNLLQLYDAIHSDPLADAQKAWEESQKGISDTMDKQQADLQKLIDSYDGSADATAKLATATNDYRTTLMNLLLQIKQVQQAIHGMFQDTIRSMTLQTLDKQGQYKYLQDEAQRLYGQALTSTNPEEIARLMQQVNADLNQAFGLLSPAQQKQMLGKFTENINTIDQAISAHLEKIGQDAADKAKETFEKIQAKLDEVAEKMGKAADNMVAAGDDMVTAANTPTTIVLVDQYGNPIPNEVNGTG